ncbi:putative DnaJ domain, Chaperone J-domain superfamily [Arabidopsis thaliana]|uniref:J domain-containing protein n=1 Tax=Arabidopsis thaliana TaxID=3702 RepID=A0A178UX82_ARATH|nr:hypothetical protein AXX17_AT4G23020 [Arabidopsis thaliana]
MESNKEEAKRALDIAEKKLSKNDYNRAKRYAKKAHRMYPNLVGLEQVLIMIDVYISASNKINGEADWYRVLGVDPLADDEAVKKRYRKLALLLHPDKNRFTGAEGAFKLVLEAWDLLSDKSQRSSYDQKRKSNQVKQRTSGMQKTKRSSTPKPEPKPKPTEPDKPASSYGPTPTPEPRPNNKPESKPKRWPRPNMPEPMPEPDIPMPMPTRHKPKSKPDISLTTVKVGTFWTVCNRCKTYCEFMRASCLNRTVPCPNCGKYFIATVIPSELVNGRLVIRLSPCNQSTWKKASDDTSSTSAMPKTVPERVKRWFDPMPEIDSSTKQLGTFWTVCSRCKTHCKLVRANHLNKTFPCPNCSQEFVAAEMIIEVINGGPVIKLSPSVQSNNKRTRDASSTTSASDKAQRPAYQKEEVLKREKIDPDVASAATGENVKEAETLFKEPMTTGNENSTTEEGIVKEAETLCKEPMTTGNENSTTEEGNVKEAETFFEEPMTTGNVKEVETLFEEPMTTDNENSTPEAERLFKKPMSTGDENSTHEAQRLFKKPMTTVNANSNLEAQRCFLRIWQREMQSLLLK